MLNQSIYFSKIYNDEYLNIDSVYFFAHQPCFLDIQFSILNKLKKNIQIYILDSPENMSDCLGYKKIK